MSLTIWGNWQAQHLQSVVLTTWRKYSFATCKMSWIYMIHFFFVFFCGFALTIRELDHMLVRWRAHDPYHYSKTKIYMIQSNKKVKYRSACAIGSGSSHGMDIRQSLVTISGILFKRVACKCVMEIWTSLSLLYKTQCINPSKQCFHVVCPCLSRSLVRCAHAECIPCSWPINWLRVKAVLHSPHQSALWDRPGANNPLKLGIVISRHFVNF